MPIMQYFNLPATARASFGCYNNAADVERLVRAVHHVRELFA
jgi:cysteine desulfurase/selenocysteine lyase